MIVINSNKIGRISMVSSIDDIHMKKWIWPFHLLLHNISDEKLDNGKASEIRLACPLTSDKIYVVFF